MSSGMSFYANTSWTTAKQYVCRIDEQRDGKFLITYKNDVGTDIMSVLRRTNDGRIVEDNLSRRPEYVTLGFFSVDELLGKFNEYTEFKYDNKALYLDDAITDPEKRVWSEFDIPIRPSTEGIPSRQTHMVDMIPMVNFLRNEGKRNLAAIADVRQLKDEDFAQDPKIIFTTEVLPYAEKFFVLYVLNFEHDIKFYNKYFLVEVDMKLEKRPVLRYEKSEILPGKSVEENIYKQQPTTLPAIKIKWDTVVPLKDEFLTVENAKQHVKADSPYEAVMKLLENSEYYAGRSEFDTNKRYGLLSVAEYDERIQYEQKQKQLETEQKEMDADAEAPLKQGGVPLDATSQKTALKKTALKKTALKKPGNMGLSTGASDYFGKVRKFEEGLNHLTHQAGVNASVALHQTYNQASKNCQQITAEFNEKCAELRTRAIGAGQSALEEACRKIKAKVQNTCSVMGGKRKKQRNKIKTAKKRRAKSKKARK